MHKVGTKNGNVRREPRQHRLTDTQCLNRSLIGAGQKMFVVWRGQAENVPQTKRKSEMHGCDPFQKAPAWC